MLKKILIILGVIVFVSGVTPVFLSSQFEVSETIQIEQPINLVFDNVADFRTWNKWSVWDQLDTNAVLSFSDVQGEVGSSRYWNGNESMGEGKMTITKLISNQEIETELNFIRPFPSTSTAGFLLRKTETEHLTNLTWTMSGESSYFGRYFNFVIEKSISEAYKQGLANLKIYVESKILEIDSAVLSIDQKTDSLKTLN